MLTCMRTTLIIDDALLRKAKHRAAERDLTVSDVVNEALRDSFRDTTPSTTSFSMITYGPVGRLVTHQPGDFAEDAEIDERSNLAR